MQNSDNNDQIGLRNKSLQVLLNRFFRMSVIVRKTRSLNECFSSIQEKLVRQNQKSHLRHPDHFQLQKNCQRFTLQVREKRPKQHKSDDSSLNINNSKSCVKNVSVRWNDNSAVLNLFFLSGTYLIIK